ncbi:xanthine dehydrogenase accessory protein XdhC [Maritimibacter dapengensis]|uniref:Xanthine dehydrogenase accessory protein XdhC n=1 Tax=Maritimibacter dapengensis TaxID=2836868 RepID=A0ABS6SZC3_9RHOB|nr:xanthine dehydrogenase accessory protein XdhC [Maritimibacter dapengensis]MBV7377868.1 xanthine dehydrogenase accessory protein XdhC [Maritimibacter dapengensis]
MSFDRDSYAALLREHSPVVRVVVAATAGSVPRETGASIVVWADGQCGTIGGGTLEFEAIAGARAMLGGNVDRKATTHALGPDLGQCCGGRVTLVWEHLDALPDGEIHARQITGTDTPPLSVTRLMQRARDRGETPGPAYLDGWMVEPITRPATPIWIWGAGHVGRALITALTPLPDLALTWVDTGPDRFPDAIPEGVTALPAPDIAAATRLAPKDAHHIVMTYSHALDLAICDGLLARGFVQAGLIGSATKWARFRKRLAEAGHPPQAIDRIRCPIGDKALGKHPAAIALGVAHQIMADIAQGAAQTDEGTGHGRRLSGD